MSGLTGLYIALYEKCSEERYRLHMQHDDLLQKKDNNNDNDKNNEDEKDKNNDKDNLDIKNDYNKLIHCLRNAEKNEKKINIAIDECITKK